MNQINQMTNSHILVNGFDYYEPATIAETIRLLVEGQGRARLLAGGTDLFVQMKMERLAPQAVISLNGIPGLAGFAQDEAGLEIGALATVRSVEMQPAVQAHYRALAEACASFSSTQVQAMGTLGGNLANASPASDSAPALLVHDAVLELAGPAGRRSLPLEQFFQGPGRTALAGGELIVGVRLPRPEPGSGDAFLKIGRVSNDIAKASVAAVVVRQGNRVIACRLAFGSVAPTPVRTRQAERLLAGQVWSETLADQAAALAASEIAPIDDVRSTAQYRRDVARAMAGDALRLAWQRAGQRSSAWPQPAGEPQAAGPAPAPVARHVAAGDRQVVELRVNGRRHRVWVAPNDLLLNVLRDQLELTGSKYGCGIGECSACTVLLDGRPVLSCLLLALAAAGHEVETIEGMARPDGTLHPLQEAFLEHSAYQCGYCTPGMLLTAQSLLAEIPQPSESDVRHYLRGNLCRCTGYASIVRAVLAAAGEVAAGAEPLDVPAVTA